MKMFCKFCGKQIQDGSKFCFYCGKSQAEDLVIPTTPVNSPVEATTPAGSVYSSTGTGYTQENTEYTSVNSSLYSAVPPVNPTIPEGQPPKKNKGLKITLAVVITLVVLVAGAFGVQAVINIFQDSYDVVKDKDDDDEDDKKDRDRKKKKHNKDRSTEVDEVVVKGTETEKDSQELNKNLDSVEAVDITAEQKTLLNGLKTDYNKIKWGVEYSIEGNPGIVISVTPYTDYDDEFGGLIVAVTNLSSQPVAAFGEGEILDAKGNSIGTVYYGSSCIAVGNTEVTSGLITVDGAVPSGVIRWNEFEIMDSYSDPGNWEGDYVFNPNNDEWGKAVELEMQNTASDKEILNTVSTLLIDENGYVIVEGRTYEIDEINPGDTVHVDVPVFASDENIARVRDIAVFSSPTIKDY